MLATPLSLEEIILAEIVWSATKATGAVAIMLVVLGSLGYVQMPGGLLLLPAAFLGGLAFGAIGMFFTGIIPSIDMFNLPIFLFVTPMFLFSGTFFPVSNLPEYAQPLALAFPLYHMAELSRRFSLGVNETGIWIGILYLTAFFMVFVLLGLRAMKKRLIQ
jgi:lipooligosaccharide transport system permease protein